jgi:predicted transcriptional regulator
MAFVVRFDNQKDDKRLGLLYISATLLKRGIILVKRFTIEMSDKNYEELERIARAREKSKAEILREGLLLRTYWFDAIKRGLSIASLDDQERVIERPVFLYVVP